MDDDMLETLLKGFESIRLGNDKQKDKQDEDKACVAEVRKQFGDQVKEILDVIQNYQGVLTRQKYKNIIAEYAAALTDTDMKDVRNSQGSDMSCDGGARRSKKGAKKGGAGPEKTPQTAGSSKAKKGGAALGDLLKPFGLSGGSQKLKMPEMPTTGGAKKGAKKAPAPKKAPAKKH